MKLKKTHWIGISFSAFVILLDFIFFFGDKIFFFLLGIALVVLILPFLVFYIIETNRQKEKNSKFLEFSRSLAESVKAGTPIGRSIINMGDKDFGTLSPNIKKLANQISIGIPLSQAFNTFALEVRSTTIKRAITLIREAGSAGGEIDFILESVSNSIYEVEKLKKERKAAISNLVVQGYIVFLIFIGIMLVMEFKILPLTEGIGGLGSISSGSFDTVTTTTESAISAEKLARPFLYLLLVQGSFAGLIIGKLAEGSVKAGIKHSIILSVAAFLITTGARAFLGG